MSQGELIYGLHAVAAALARHPEQLVELWVDRKRHDPRVTELTQAAQASNIALHTLSRAELDELSEGAVHQGVVARCRSLPSYDEHDLEQLIENLQGPALLLVLDGVQDPHNLGACLRSADAAGVHAVIAPRDRATGLTSTVRKVACGAAEHVPFVQVTNLARALEVLKSAGVWLVGLAGEAEQSLYEIDLKGPIALVMGAEDKGLRRLTREHCDYLAKIPMQGGVSSLNVSVATGVCLFEAVRQRRG